MSTENNICAPRLRFPGFTGEWKEVLVKDICSINTGKSNTQDQVQEGMYPFYIRSAVPVKSNRYLCDCEAVITIGDGQIGKVFHYVDGKFDLHQRCYMMSNFKDVFGKYFYYYFSEHFYERAMRMTARATVDSVRLEMISEMPILLPPTLAEQEKIAKCLSLQDELISAQEQNVEALKEEKKGLMQQLFPQDGETSPRRRFAGCSGDWDVKRLGDICESMLVGFPFKGRDITNDVSGHPILRAYSIGAGNIMHGEGYDKFYPHDAKALEKYQVRSGDIVIAMDGSVGRNIAMVSDAEDGFLLIQRVARLRIKDYPIQLIYQQIISQRFKDFALAEKVGSIISHISQKQIESFPIFLPFSKDEQRKIADCLTALDDQIAAESAKLEALKEHKKGLMQQLFPQPAK